MGKGTGNLKCACVRACVSEREKEKRERERQIDKLTNSLFYEGVV